MFDFQWRQQVQILLNRIELFGPLLPDLCRPFWTFTEFPSLRLMTAIQSKTDAHTTHRIRIYLIQFRTNKTIHIHKTYKFGHFSIVYLRAILTGFFKHRLLHTSTMFWKGKTTSKANHPKNRKNRLKRERKKHHLMVKYVWIIIYTKCNTFESILHDAFCCCVARTLNAMSSTELFLATLYLNKTYWPHFETGHTHSGIYNGRTPTTARNIVIISQMWKCAWYTA